MLARRGVLLAAGLVAAGGARAVGLRRPVFDAHVQYSHDAVIAVPPEQAVAILRGAGLYRAMESSSDDEGTQKLYALAPDLVIPSLRPYRRRADLSGWTSEPAIIDYVERRLDGFRYRAIGEFHVFGDEVKRPVVRRVVAMAARHGLWLHAHSDAAAIDLLFAEDPGARVLWAHSGFEQPEGLVPMLKRHARLYCDLAFRGDHAPGGVLLPAWRALFEAFPDRFLVGTDTFVPERWHAIGSHADSVRGWVSGLAEPLAEAIAWRNGDALFSLLPR